MSKWREKWQAWKKENPAFEQTRAAKNDIGPLMDDIQHEMEALIRAFKTIEVQLKAAEKAKIKFENGLGEYYKSVISVYSNIIKEAKKKKDDKSVKMRSDQIDEFDERWNSLIQDIQKGLPSENTWKPMRKLSHIAF